MAPETSAELRRFTKRGLAMAPQVEGAFLAQLEDGEHPDHLPPARFATLASRAVVLSECGIDWTAEVTRLRALPPGFVKVLALKLATGEIDARHALAELTDFEAELTCRVGGLFLEEVCRRAQLPPNESAPSEG